MWLNYVKIYILRETKLISVIIHVKTVIKLIELLNIQLSRNLKKIPSPQPASQFLKLRNAGSRFRTMNCQHMAMMAL